MQVLTTGWQKVIYDANADIEREVRFIRDNDAKRKWWEIRLRDEEDVILDTISMIVNEGRSLTKGLKDAFELTKQPMPPDLEIGLMAGFHLREMNYLEEGYAQLKIR